MHAPERALVEAPDGEIVALVAAGQREAFEVLVRRHNQRLFRAVRAVMRSDPEAEDVLQQAWLDIYHHLAQFRGDAAFSTWATAETATCLGISDEAVRVRLHRARAAVAATLAEKMIDKLYAFAATAAIA